MTRCDIFRFVPSKKASTFGANQGYGLLETPQNNNLSTLKKAVMSGVTSFIIELDRPNGVYYGGEVVRGKVKLVTSKDIKTRGVRVRFQGLGYMHFHTGSGDNRSDYYGTKIFEEHRFTMFGNYYNTTILDNAGADAYFGAASGDGIMYIPCNENENLNLIVRVMDYDFGKKDDLLGEIVLDANSLISSGVATSFPLTRRGGSEKGEVTLSAKIMPMNAVFPASNSGNAPYSAFGHAQGRTYNAVCQLRTHQATGLRKADFIGKNDVYVQAYRAPDNVNRSKALPEPDRTTVLPAGTLEFPFAFPVRADAPGSAELGVEDASFIRYSLYANIDIAWWRDPSVRRMLTVLPTRPLPSPALLRAIEYKCNDPMRLSSCCLLPCFSVGTTTIDAKLGRQAFAPGEKLDFHLNASNNTSTVLEVKVILLCKILLQEHHHQRGRSTHCEITHTLHSVLLEPHQALQIGYGYANGSDPNPAAASASSPLNNDKSKSTPLVLPNVCPSFNGASGLATAVKEPVTFAYIVQFKVSTPGCCGTSRSVTFPV